MSAPTTLAKHLAELAIALGCERELVEILADHLARDVALSRQALDRLDVGSAEDRLSEDEIERMVQEDIEKLRRKRLNYNDEDDDYEDSVGADIVDRLISMRRGGRPRTRFGRKVRKPAIPLDAGTGIQTNGALQVRHLVGTRGCRGACKFAAGIDLVDKPGRLLVKREGSRCGQVQLGNLR